MTTTTRPVRRETFTSIRDRGESRPLIIEIHSTYVTVRGKGTRHRYTVTYDQIWNLGARNAAEEARKLKAEKRKARVGRKLK